MDFQIVSTNIGYCPKCGELSLNVGDLCHNCKRQHLKNNHAIWSTDRSDDRFAWVSRARLYYDNYPAEACIYTEDPEGTPNMRYYVIIYKRADGKTIYNSKAVARGWVCWEDAQRFCELGGNIR